jgi:hypothetical protein
MNHRASCEFRISCAIDRPTELDAIREVMVAPAAAWLLASPDTSAA